MSGGVAAGRKGASAWPCAAAACNGVEPLSRGRFTHAPCERSATTAPVRPAAAAACSAVRPLESRRLWLRLERGRLELEPRAVRHEQRQRHRLLRIAVVG